MPQPIDPTTHLTSPIAGDARADARTPDRLQVAALVQQFEGMLLTEMLRDLRMGEADDESFGLGGATMADTMRGEFGLALSKSGGFGLGEMLAEAFARRQGARSVDETTPVTAAVPGVATAATSAVARALAAATGETAGTEPQVTSAFGWRADPFTGQARFHAGTDVRAAYGSPVVALAGGTVTFAGERGGYGSTVVIDHGDGRETLLAHLSAIDVHVGDHVRAGQAVGRSGNSGRATGAHLHVEVREAGRPVDPATADLAVHRSVENGSW
jgi:murein DD-endopeptidase MepM/ murein hydrolase activator NlpD